jgi:hypothetical protein
MLVFTLHGENKRSNNELYLTTLRTQFYNFYKIYNIEGTQLIHGKCDKGDKGKCSLLLP